VADDAVMADFAAYLEESSVPFEAEELESHRDEVARQIVEEMLRQVFGEGTSRRRSVAWDAQLQVALEQMPRARRLLENPGAYVAELRQDDAAADSRQASREP
jgi:hypothetical protein